MVPSSIVRLDVINAMAFASPADPGQGSVPLLLVQAAAQLCAARSSAGTLLNNGIAVGALVCVGRGSRVSVGTLVGAITARICTQISPLEDEPKPKRFPRLSSSIHTPLY